MTATPAEDAQAAAAQAAGEAAAHAHEAAALAQHQLSGSGTAVEAAQSPDDVSVPWFGSDNHPGLGPTAPQSHSPNVSDPLDNSQSQP